MLFEKCLQLRTEALGETHTDTLDSMNDLAELYKNQGKYDDARILYDKCLNLRINTLGESHRDTLESVNNLAVLYDKRGEYEHAWKMLGKEEVGLGRMPS